MRRTLRVFWESLPDHEIRKGEKHLILPTLIIFRIFALLAKIFALLAKIHNQNLSPDSEGSES